jgi:hypothetical protein
LQADGRWNLAALAIVGRPSWRAQPTTCRGNEARIERHRVVAGVARVTLAAADGVEVVASHAVAAVTAGKRCGGHPLSVIVVHHRNHFAPATPPPPACTVTQLLLCTTLTALHPTGLWASAWSPIRILLLFLWSKPRVQRVRAQVLCCEQLICPCASAVL